MMTKNVSVTLAFVLRHGAPKLGLVVQDGGYISVDALLALREFAGVTIETLREIVNHDRKGRYSFSEDGKAIRANQGHSFPVPNESESLLRRVTDPKEIPHCIHGTYARHLASIEREGLSRMGRQHIHFATGIHAKSGMRRDCDLHIHLNIGKAMAEGCPFYMSTNGVILSPGFGDTGAIPSRYFHKVVRL
jgi:RNA:NAD 2'-phosphotransferase (TPT1/KptA family)